jgi:hypothetical protein
VSIKDILVHIDSIPASGERVRETKQLSPAELMQSRVADDSSDLVVMGASGHSRLRETVLGCVTRDMLRSVTVPVLMALRGARRGSKPASGGSNFPQRNDATN